VAVAATGAFPGFPKKGKVDEVVVPQRVSQGDGCGDGKKETQTLATISSHPLGCGLLACQTNRWLRLMAWGRQKHSPPLGINWLE